MAAHMANSLIICGRGVSTIPKDCAAAFKLVVAIASAETVDTAAVAAVELFIYPAWGTAID